MRMTKKIPISGKISNFGKESFPGSLIQVVHLKKSKTVSSFYTIDMLSQREVSEFDYPTLSLNIV